MNTIAQAVLEIVAKETSIAPENIFLDSTLQEMDVHSLDGLQIIFELEDKFDINVPEDQAKFGTATVRQLIEGVERLVAAKVAPIGQ